jgi:zinc protease
MRRSTALVLASSSSFVAGAAGAERPLTAEKVPELRFEKHVLGNGLMVILHPERSGPLVAVNLWYDVGSEDEKPGDGEPLEAQTR